MRNAFAMLFLLPGSPCAYYGTESGGHRLTAVYAGDTPLDGIVFAKTLGRKVLHAGQTHTDNIPPNSMAVSLAACNKKNTATSANASAQGGVSGNLVVWMVNDQWANAVIAGFSQKYPDVKASCQIIGNVDTRGKVSLDGPAGIGPDVFLMPHDSIGLAVSDGLCEPFDVEPQAKYVTSMLEASIQTCTSDGKLYAVPISTENIAFFYNKDLLGDTPVPQSFEEVVAFAQKYNVPAQNKWAFRRQVDDSYHNYFFLTAFGMRVFGSNMDDYRNPGFDSPGRG
jgi:arabinogalactan oligomer/maltooligosaccharide transport system substrate-binding protein